MRQYLGCIIENLIYYACMVGMYALKNVRAGSFFLLKHSFFLLDPSFSWYYRIKQVLL